MKPSIFLLCVSLFFFLSGDLAAQGLFKRAKRTTENEAGKKVDEGIKNIFNPKKKKKKEEAESSEASAEAKAEEPAENPPSTESKTENDPVKVTSTETPETPAPKPEMSIKSKSSDFIPGELVLFEDPVENERLGEFPSKWDLVNGTIEVAEFDGEQVIAYMTSQSTILPLMKTEEYLPEKFTIEFEVYFHNRGNEGYYINFFNRVSIRINKDNLQYAGSTTRSKNGSHDPGWRKVALSFNQRALKVYLDGERLINVPNVKDELSRVQFKALSHGASQGKPAAIKNIRIAEGAVPLYDKLLTDGKIVTNDIHFEVNSAILKLESMPIIDKIVKLMDQHPNVQFRIEGHTDSDGSDSHNLALSERRAVSVKKAMMDKGINEERMTTMGYGESKPVFPNNSDENKAKNRRVEFILIK